MKKLVYLAGPISGLSYEDATQWRLDVAEKLHRYWIKCLSPLYGKHYLKDVEKIADTYENIALSSAKGITSRDRFFCQQADVLFVNLLGAEKVSIGTVMEIAWADSYGKPIVLVIEESGNVHDHGMIREVSAFRVSTIDAGIQIVTTILP